MKQYLFEYEYSGSRWSISIYADDEADARERFRRASQGQYLGELVAIIPACGGLAMPFVDVACMVRNWWRRVWR